MSDGNHYTDISLAEDLLLDQIARLRGKLFDIRNSKNNRSDDLDVKGSNRDKYIKIRVTEDESNEVREQAEISGLSISNYSRKRILGIEVKSKTDMMMIRELRRIAGLQKHIFLTSDEGRRFSEDTAEIIRDIRTAISNIVRGN